MRFATVNARSLKSRENLISEAIEEYKLNVLKITETWLQVNEEDNQWTKSSELNTYGYLIQTINRINRRGGGIALITKDETKITTLDTNNYRSFENKMWNIQFKLKPTCTITRVCHPPSNHQANDKKSTFLDQFTDLLTLLSSRSKNIIILGDVNMHIDNMENQDAQMLLDSLVAFNLTQHVKITTHNRHHTLEVIITPTEDGLLQTTNTIAGPYISDHRLVILETMETQPKTQTERHKMRKINESTIHTFCEYFYTDPIKQVTTLEEAVNHLNQEMLRTCT